MKKIITVTERASSECKKVVNGYTENDFLYAIGDKYDLPQSIIITGFSWHGERKINSPGREYSTVNFPDQCSVYPVSGISEFAFEGTRIEEVSRWPELCSFIGSAAFKNTPLKKIPNSWVGIEHLGDATFAETRIDGIPGRWGDVTYIGNHCFHGTKISRIPVNWENVEEVGDYAFAFTGVPVIPVDWSNVCRLGRNPFARTKVNWIPYLSDTPE